MNASLERRRTLGAARIWLVFVALQQMSYYFLTNRFF
jgi:hypothetical protein